MTVELYGKPTLLHAVDAALVSQARPVIVVTGHDGALALLGDMPRVKPTLLNALAAEIDSHSDAITVVSKHNGKRDNPALLMRRLFASAMALKGDVGARSLLAEADVVEMPTDDPGVLVDIDTAGR